ncbi:hypothetical protein ACH4E8_29520 [Streptomyces sp. NPDC017979]|uniref:hypothetical protein n=1 Tax=Streptomyces sp. NPDC017979 TaxID=3365024 RepID=UPI00379B05D1
MSSAYRILCLSHDPAIATSSSYHYPEGAEDAIRDQIQGHAHCDLVIGRYSGGLVEIGCPSTPDPATGRCVHGSTVWIDSDWLRLLAAAHTSADTTVQHAAQHRCMPWHRLRRLRNALDLPRTGPDEPTT